MGKVGLLSDWHLDKRINVAMILALASIGVSAWVKIERESERTDIRLEQIEQQITEFNDRDEQMRGQMSVNARDIAVLIAQMNETNRGVDRLREEVSSTNNLLRALVRQTAPLSIPEGMEE